MPRYTYEQMDRARNTDLVSYLHARGEKLVRAGGEYRWLYYDGAGEHDSVTVRGGEWYDHKNEVGGDAIGFLQEFMDSGFKEAVAELLGEAASGRAMRAPTKQSAPAPKEFVLPERAANMRRICAYLNQTRLLPPEIITHFVRAGSLYEESGYHNAVFLGMDEAGTARAATLKGTMTVGNSFRQTLTGSDTRYCFNHKGMSGKVYVFEAPIDMLSFISMHQQDWQQHSYLALDGLSSKALHFFLAQHPHIREVYLCLDNDAAGIEAVDKFSDELAANGYDDVKRLVSEMKDWNEDIRARRGLPAVLAQKHPKIEAYHDTVAALAAKHSGAGDILLQLARDYKPYTDKGKLKFHAEELRQYADALTNFADACIRACVYIQTDYAADLARREVFEQTREAPEPAMTMNY